MQLSKGGNAALPAGIVEVTLNFASRPQGLDIDVSAYLLTAAGVVRGDADMVFYNQPKDADGAVTLDVAQSRYRVDTSLLPAAIERIAICVVVDGGPASSLGSIDLEVLDGPSYRHDVTGSTESAIIVGELYVRNGQWKLRAIGQGFAGGLDPLARSFGMDVEDDAGTAAPAPAPAPTGKVSLKKVTLEKSGKVSLRKGGGSIRAQLIWEGRGGDGEGDLDFYCFYVLKDGTEGKVYWKDGGAADRAPYITLSGDSLSAGMEEIVLHRPDELKFALFAAYSAVSNGTGSFASYEPRVVLTDQTGNEVTIPLLDSNETSYWVAISHVAVADEISISHVETYGVRAGHFGKSATDAERSPRLHADGSWDVSLGVVEFKD